MSDNRASETSTSGFVPQVYCRSCASPLVQAADWAKTPQQTWHVLLWCPECGYEREAELEGAQVTYLSLAIEEGFASMLETLVQMDAEAFGETFLDILHAHQPGRPDSLEPLGS